jgi:quercetin dioxygenase-like cupin family protein
MRAIGVIVAIAYFCASPANAQELDSPKADPSHHKVEFENDQVRVIHWAMPPGDKTALHKHPSLADVHARITVPDGKSSDIHGKAGSAAWRGPTTHTDENMSDKPIEGILVEPKTSGNAGWLAPVRDSVNTDPETHNVEFENDHVRVVRVHYLPGQKSRMHDHPAQVQIWLTDANVRFTMPDGKAREDHPKAGLVRWVNSFSHGTENIGDKPFDRISVELKGANYPFFSP